MNFVTQLEDYLRDLGAEARKKHPGVKEASERAIVKLRSLQNQYVSAVRKASGNGEKHPDTKLFRSSDLLHPFLLAANYPNASPKLLDTSFKAMKLLMEANAICPGDGMNMVRVWMIQAQVVVSYSATNKDGNNIANGGLGGGISSVAVNSAGKLSSLSHAVTSASNAIAGAAGTKRSSSFTPTSPTTDVDQAETKVATKDGEGIVTTTSSSWFGGYFSASSNGNAVLRDTKMSSSTATETKMANIVTAKSAVSSSHGQAGSGHLYAKDLEKLALDILSCLLQLLELRDLPVSREQWTHSVTICCLLYMPLRQNVRQAAQSTLPQVLTLLVKDKDASQLALKTWEDLLACALGTSTISKKSLNSGNTVPEKRCMLQGAFSHCRMGDKDASLPPSPSLSLELMATLLTEAPDIFAGVGQKTFGVIVQILQNQSKINSNVLPVEYLRALQFALTVLQTQSTEWTAECRELISRLIQPIPLATEAIRQQADFEDGFIYTVPKKQIQATVLSSSGNKTETMRGVSPTVLWKAALCMETLKAFVQSEANKDIWTHPDVIGLVLESTSDFCSIGASCEDHMNLLVRACRGQGESASSLAHSAETLDSIDRWQKGKSSSDVYVIGDALWTGFTALLKMIEQLDESVLEQAFAPSLSALQHYLKRFPASGTIVQRSLEGYFSLAKVSLNEPMLRGALMASLCKLSLPQWGSNDTSAVLKDHNIAALICLLNVLHRYHDKIGSEWSIVLQTFEELSTLKIASPELSDNAYVGALSISAVYPRIAPFSTCLSDESLDHFLSGLREVARTENPPAAIPSPVGGSAVRKVEKVQDSPEERAGIGEKLMNIGARAIPWTSDGYAQQEDVPVAERTKNNYYGEYKTDFLSRLETSRHPIRNKEATFTLILLADVAMSNTFRKGRSLQAVYETLCSVASESSVSRVFCMDITAMLIMSQVAGEDCLPSSFTGPSKILFIDPKQNQYLAVENSHLNVNVQEGISQICLLAPLCDFISNAETANVSETGLEALFSILESSGHRMQNDTWIRVIQSIASVPTAGHASTEWSDSCQLGFRCLKLIVDDFLEDAATAARTVLLDCCSAFGSSRQDVNTSLTAIGLLWSIADQDVGTESVERALSKLVYLSADTRPEVRNCSVNTLFSCVVGRGPTFTEAQWQSCICTTIFGVYDAVTANSVDGGEIAKVDRSRRKQRYQVSVHHSRDSSDKQWLATRALVLNGLSRLLRNFFNCLLNTTDDGKGAVRGNDDTPWFYTAWNKILGYGYDAAVQDGGRDTLELRNAGVELLALANQLSCAAGMQAAITPARVSTNMEVVNGALRSVRSPEKTDNTSHLHHAHSAVTEVWRENLFLDSFDVLDSYREHLDACMDQNLCNSDPTQAQVLTKLASELTKLYDCCKENEFVENVSLGNCSSFVELLAVTSSPSDDSALIVRFVRMVTSVARSSSMGTESKFLSQAQRFCVELLKTMLRNGSPEAAINLTSFAGIAFFAERESDGKPKTGVSILSHEASNILVHGISSQKISPECKLVILGRILNFFLDENDGTVKKRRIESMAVGTYKNLVPIMSEGLASAKSVNSVAQESMMLLLDHVWNQVVVALSHMLLPAKIGQKQATISNATDLVELVKAASINVPEKHASELCSILSKAATRSLEIAKLHEGTDEAMNDSLRLFGACFAGACSRDQVLQSTGKRILSSAASSLYLKSPKIDLDVRASQSICRALQESEAIEDAVIAIFPELSRLVGVEESSVRRAAVAVMAKANISDVLAAAQSNCDHANERAANAEKRMMELENEIEMLQKEKEALERQLGLL